MPAPEIIKQLVERFERDLGQVADILMGAIGYEMNGAHTRTSAKKSQSDSGRNHRS